MNLTAPIRQHAAERPRAVALITPGLRLSYAELDGAVWRMAGYLAEKGVRRGDRLGVVIAACAVGAVVSLALSRMGAVQYWFAASDTAEIQQVGIKQFGLGRLITDSPSDGSAFQQSITVEPRLQAYDHLPAEPFLLTDEDADLPWLGMMSSGTTGDPKALFQTHRQTWKRYLTMRSALPMLVYDRIFSLPPMHFSVTLQRLHWATICGGAIVLPDTYAVPVTVDYINESRASVLWVTPLHLNALVAVAKQRRLSGHLLPHVRDLLCSTAAIDDDLRAAGRKYVAPNMVVAYGASEIGFLSAVGSFGTGDAPGSIGYPVPGVEVQLVGDSGVIEAAGQVGMIRARSDTMTTSYLNDPETTARYFKDGWFYPGDLASWNEDGQLIFHGRTDDMMIMDGINIYPAEIESVLLRHPSIAEAVAFPLKSQEHQHIPVAAIVLREPIDNRELEAFYRARLGVKAPRYVLVVDAFPRNAAGKVLTGALAEQFERRRGRTA